MDEGLARSLESAVGSRHVLIDPELTSAYETDWTRRWSGPAAAVVAPGSTEEVCEVVRMCAARAVPLVPQGGNTGLVGGSVPRDGEVVVRLNRMDDLDEVDAGAGMLVAGAGAVLADVQAAASAVGMEFPVDLAARDSATIGGMVATNAGGVHVIRHGPMRSNVTGLQAVLADGRTIDRLDGPEKDDAGYDMVGLLTGSEGTLGIVTRARLRLVPRPRHTVTALAGVGDTADRASLEASCLGPATAAALRVLGRVRRSTDCLRAAELMYQEGMSLVVDHAGLRKPLRRAFPAYLLVECAAQSDPTDELAAALGACPEVLDSAVASDGLGRTQLWEYRDRHTEAVATLGVPHKLDISLPIGALARFVSEVGHLAAGASPEWKWILWGHAGEGNLHLNVVGPAADDTAVDDSVLRLVLRFGGSVSAEHGIGVAKAKWLALARSPGDLAAMRAVKDALDPSGLMNPGVIFGGETR